MRVKVEVSNDCNLCGLCVETCPTNVFQIVNQKLTINEANCIYCRGCEAICPQKAIKLEALDEGLEITITQTLTTLITPLKKEPNGAGVA